jgi:hypothetical protein
MKFSLLLLTTPLALVASSLSAQVTVIPADFDSEIDFWQSPTVNADKSGNPVHYASNSMIGGPGDAAAWQTEYDWAGMLIQFDVSGITPAEVNAPGFQALLDVQFQGYWADENRYAAYNPDPSPTPGAGDGAIYLDVYPVLESYPNVANRWLKNSTSGSFVNWDDTVPTTLAEAQAVGGNFGESGELPASPVDQTIFRPGWTWSEESLAADLGSSARLQWAPGAGPVHLGKAGTLWSGAPGDSMDDSGNALIGDGDSEQNFGIVLAFDTTEAFRTKVSNGESVVLKGTTIFEVDDGFGGTTQVTLGDLSWADLFVTVQGYGNSLDGSFGDDVTLGNPFRTQAAGNLDPADAPLTNATYDYAVGPALTFSADPFAQEADFEIDVTALISAIALDATTDRVYIGLFARKDGDGAGTGYVGSDGEADNDRIAFYSSSFELAAGTPAPAIPPTMPNEFGELVWDVTSIVQDWVNGVTQNYGVFVHVNKALSWGEQVNFNTSERVIPEIGLAAGDAAPLLRLGQAPTAAPIEGILAAPDLNVEIESLAGYYYQLEASFDGMSTWQPIGDPIIGTGGILQFVQAAPGGPGEKVFYRVVTSMVP